MSALAPPTVRIMAYLGQLRQGADVSVMQLTADLHLAYSTCALHITSLERMKYIDAIRDGGTKRVKLAATLDPKVAIAVIPEWEDSYGTHPTQGLARRAQIAMVDNKENEL